MGGGLSQPELLLEGKGEGKRGGRREKGKGVGRG